MKKYGIYILTLLASATLIGCSQEPDKVIPVGDKTSGYAVSAELESMTRAQLDADLNVVWTAGDKIRIFGETKPSGEIYTTANNGTATGIFTPASEESAVTDPERYAIYPASAVVSATLDYNTVGVNFGGIAAQTYSADLDVSNIASLPMAASSNGNEFLFKNLCGGVLLQLNEYQNLDIMITSVEVRGNAGEQIAGTVAVDASTGALTLSTGATANTITVTSAGVHINTASDLANSKGFVIFLPAATYADGLTFTLTDSEGRVYTKTTSAAVTVSAGVVTPLTPLQMTIYYGTENCYLVSGAQTIDIDVTPYYILADNYARKGTKVVDADGAVKGLPVSASVVWQQPELASPTAKVVSETLTLSGSTLKVTATGTKGNALVAVKNAAGTILWSYHIWVSEVNDLLYQNGTYHMDRNLGATSNVQAVRDAFGLFYQWGRKDPFGRKLDEEHSTSTTSNPTGIKYGNFPSADIVFEDGAISNQTIDYATRNPQTFILSSDDWLSNYNSYLWTPDSPSTAKTVYDPCPSGYRVADVADYQWIFENNAKDGACGDPSIYGYNFDVNDTGTKSYFPLNGQLVPTGANAKFCQYMDWRAHLWLSEVWSDKPEKPRYFYYNTGGPKLENSGFVRAYGHAVRCKKSVN